MWHIKTKTEHYAMFLCSLLQAEFLTLKKEKKVTTFKHTKSIVSHIPDL